MTDTDDNPGPRKYAENTQGRPFEKGNRGRPAGSRNKVTVAVESLMGEYGPQVTARVIKRACEGDTTAARLILDRIAPVRRGRAVHLKMPELGDAPSVMNAHAALLGDVASGKVTPEEAEPVSAMLGTHLKTIETGARAPLHVRHVGIIVQVRVVLGFFLDDAENTGRCLASLLAARHRRSQNPAIGVVDSNPLVAQRNDCHDRFPGSARLDRRHW